MFMGFNFLSSRDTEKNKTPPYFCRQDASKHVFGDLEKSILMFDPRPGLLTPNTLSSNIATLPKTRRIEIQEVFSYSLMHLE